MKTIKLFFFLAAAFFACTNLYAQVTIGGLDDPRAGALLDLNSDAKGGLLLSNVNITDLELIPAGTGYFPGITTSADMDVNPGLRGAIVYNTNETTGAGIYVWNGKRWWPIAMPDDEQILFTVHATGNTYSIPTAGHVCGTYHTYDWDITVDGQPVVTVDCLDGHYTGTGGEPFDGIELTGLTVGNHQIRITPHGGADPGWGNAFGYCDSIFGAHTPDNKRKLISLDAPITTMAFVPKISESTTNANAMFAALFIDCSNLTTAAVIKDTYKLPKTITNLGSFLSGTHRGNSALILPIDLASLSGWISENQKISSLPYFLYYTHGGNSALASPIDLTPLAGWFNGNTSITDLTAFLYGTHSDNSTLANPIVLAPLSDWFKGNQKIENLGSFLFRTHSANGALANPIDLAPLFGWFNGNQTIKSIGYFLAYTHTGNNSNIALAKPIDLAPLKDWFNGNTSITNLEGFLAYTHSDNNNLTAPIDLLPLSGWFSANREMSSLTSFLNRTHYANPGFKLTGQFIFPDWIETMKLTGGTTPIWNVGNAFFRTFCLGSSQDGNTTEPTFFQDGTTLSNLGKPAVTNVINIDPDTGLPNETTDNKGTYTNRNGFSPAHENWK